MHYLREVFIVGQKIYVTCILDEASAILTSSLCKLADLFNPESRILCNIVIVGDPKQLPPYWPDINSSRFSVYDSTISVDCCQKYETILNIQYRMPLQINNFLNKLFYTDHNLECGKLDKGKSECIFWHHCNRTVEKNENDIILNTNIEEIEAILRFISSLRLNESSKYLIITPYRDQKHKIFTLYPDLKDSVCTIDQAQGLEADYILLSLVKTFSTSFITENRACVAFSRAKKELHIFGNYTCSLKGKNLLVQHLQKESKLVED